MMDDYERNWRKVARSQSWDELCALYSLLQFKHELRLERQAAHKRRRAKRKQQDIARVYAENLSPVKDWTGAAWVSPSGDIYPVMWGEHSLRARSITRKVFRRKGWGEAALVRRGWVRVSDEGNVTDHFWKRAKHSSQAQLSALWAMHERARFGEGVTPFVGYQLRDFVSGLDASLAHCIEEAA